jgi:ketosteroid isomerase-like protein
MSQEYVEAVRRSVDGWNRDDFEACVSIAHPEVEWVSDLALQIHGPDAVYRGIEGVRRYWDEWHELWNARLEVTEMLDLGDTVLVLAKTSALGDASGVEYEQLIAYVYRFEDGLARRVRSYHDPDRAFEAVGLAR